MKINRKTAIAMIAAFVFGFAPPIQQALVDGTLTNSKVIIAVVVGSVISGLVGATKELVLRELPKDDLPPRG
jgi:high-affinity nickel permease